MNQLKNKDICDIEEIIEEYQKSSDLYDEICSLSPSEIKILVEKIRKSFKQFSSIEKPSPKIIASALMWFTEIKTNYHCMMNVIKGTDDLMYDPSTDAIGFFPFLGSFKEQ